MAKSAAQRQAEYRARREEERLDVSVPKGTRERLKALADRHRVTVGTMIEQLINDAVLPRIPAAEKARQLVVQCGDDVKRAQATLLQDVKARWPGFVAGGAGTEKGGPFYAAAKEYDAIRKELNKLSRA